MSADFRCDCGHAIRHHGLPGDFDDGREGCRLCECEVTRLQEPGVPSEANEAATSTHALFTEYLAAGFTRAEALELVKAVTVAGIGKAEP